MTLRRGLHNRCLSVLESESMNFPSLKKTNSRWKWHPEKTEKKTEKSVPFFWTKTIQIMSFQVFGFHWINVALSTELGGCFLPSIFNLEKVSFPYNHLGEISGHHLANPMTVVNLPRVRGGMYLRSKGLIMRPYFSENWWSNIQPIMRPIMRPFRGVVRFGRGIYVGKYFDPKPRFTSKHRSRLDVSSILTTVVKSSRIIPWLVRG